MNTLRTLLVASLLMGSWITFGGLLKAEPQAPEIAPAKSGVCKLGSAC